jgi:hypothetical protein
VDRRGRGLTKGTVGIYLEELRKTVEGKRCLRLYFNPGLPEYVAGVLTTMAASFDTSQHQEGDDHRRQNS